MRLFILTAFITSIFATILPAQDLRVSTVTRPPFSMQEGGEDTGFSIDLWRALMMDMRRNTEIIRADEFSGMLDLLRRGKQTQQLQIFPSPPSAKAGLISASRYLNPACKSWSLQKPHLGFQSGQPCFPKTCYWQSPCRLQCCWLAEC